MSEIDSQCADYLERRDEEQYEGNRSLQIALKAVQDQAREPLLQRIVELERQRDELAFANENFDFLCQEQFKKLRHTECQRDELLALIKEVEWACPVWGGSPTCPWCDKDRKMGHTSECPYPAAIASVKGDE